MEQLEANLQYTFQNQHLLEMALMHSSWVNESSSAQGLSQQQQDNERLEFLGDAVLELSISSELYIRYPDAKEGVLTQLRASLVNKTTLATLARALRLDRCIRMGRGEESQGGRARDSMLADALEALFGAIYQDGGFEAAKKVILSLYTEHWPKHMNEQHHIKNSKTALQEYTQKLADMNYALPRYIPENQTSQDSEQGFTVFVELPDGQRFRATGRSRRVAEQEAAALALETLKSQQLA